MIQRRSYRSARRPTNGIASAETTMYTVMPSDRAERLQSRSSAIGFSIRPRAERGPAVEKEDHEPYAQDNPAIIWTPHQNPARSGWLTVASRFWASQSWVRLANVRMLVDHRGGRSRHRTGFQLAFGTRQLRQYALPVVESGVAAYTIRGDHWKTRRFPMTRGAR